MRVAGKFRYGIAFVCAAALIISFAAEYHFCFDSQLAGWLAYAFILFLVAVQTLATGKIVKYLMPVFFERHSGKIYVITPIISAAGLCAMLTYNLMASLSANTEALRGAIVFNIIPFAAAAICVIICQITRQIVKRQGSV